MIIKLICCYCGCCCCCSIICQSHSQQRVMIHHIHTTTLKPQRLCGKLWGTLWASEKLQSPFIWVDSNQAESI